MKIVNRETFLKMEGQVLFAKYESQIFGELAIKVETCLGGRDFAYDSIIDFDSASCVEMSNMLFEAERDPGKSLTLDLHYTSRDGMYDQDQLFAVFEKRDVEQIINRLKEILDEKTKTTS